MHLTTGSFKKEHNSFLPSYMTMSEFLQRALVIDGYIRVDDDTRTLLLLEASDFRAFESLQIERNFFTFTLLFSINTSTTDERNDHISTFAIVFKHDSRFITS